MKKFFILVISLAILAIAGYGIAYVVIPVTSIELSEYTHSIDLVCEDAYIVRDETIYYSASDGIVYNIVADGSRVSQNSQISTVYNGDVEFETLLKLRNIDEKINKLKTRSTESRLYTTDAASVENEIAQKMSEVVSIAQKNNVADIGDIRADINNLRTGDVVSAEEKIEALYIDRINIESTIPASKTDTVSDRAGVFSSYVDGLESVLTPERISEYTPAYIRSLTTDNSRHINGINVITGDPICKVMNNHNWYIAGICNEEQRPLVEGNPYAMVRFPNLSGSSVKCELSYLSEPDENGESLFLYKIKTYLESAFSFRNIDAQIVFKEYSGYKVPTDSIRTGESINSYYVYARKGSGTYKCDIDILYTNLTEGYSIIQSTDTANNILSSMERLVVGER